MSDTLKEEHLETKPLKNDPPIKPKNSRSVAVYLVILFAAAFLLLLMAYFMQQRSSNQVIGNLQDSVSQFQTVDELREENQKLREDITVLEQQKDELVQQVSGLQNDYAEMQENFRKASLEAHEATWSLSSMIMLMQIRAYYLAGEVDLARAWMEGFSPEYLPGFVVSGTELDPGVEAQLETPRYIYDRLHSALFSED